MTGRQATSPFGFAVPLHAVYAAAFIVAEVLPTVDAHGTVAAGLTFDLIAVYGGVWVAGDYRAGRQPPNQVEAAGRLARYGLRSKVDVT